MKKTEDIVKMGDEIMVKCLGVDEKGRVRLSRKAAMEDRDKEMGGEQQPPADAQPAGEPEPVGAGAEGEDRRRPDRGGRR